MESAHHGNNARNSIVNVVKTTRDELNFEEVLAPLEVEKMFSNVTLLLKITLTHGISWKDGTVTDPLVLDKLLEYFLTFKNAKEIFVVESDSKRTSALNAAKKNGILETCHKHGVEFVNMSKAKEKVKIEVKNPLEMKYFNVPKSCLEEDARILSLAKLTTDSKTKVSLGMKNMLGFHVGRGKIEGSRKNLDKVIVDINSVLTPHLTIIDGIIAHEGKVPTLGKAKEFNTIIAGNDVVATDSVGAELMEFDPFKIYHINMGEAKGIGTITERKVIGENINEIKTFFTRA